jgi:hypothetical protein
VYRVGGSSGKGFYALQPELRGTASEPIIILGTDASIGDIAVPVVTLDDEQYIYTMGKDIDGITITGSIILGKSSTGGKAFDKVKTYFAKHRVSVSKKPITLSLPGSAYIRFYLTKMVIGQADPEFHIQSFMFRGHAISPKK